MQGTDRAARIADGALVAMASVLAWCFARASEHAQMAPIVIGALAGLVARAPRLRKRRWVTLAAGAAVVVVVALGAGSSLLRGLAYPHALDRVAAITFTHLALPVLALFALAGGARGAPFAVGLAVAALDARWWVEPGAPLVVCAFVLARWAFSAGGEPARQRASSLGAGTCAGLAAIGLAYDLVARTWEPSWCVHVDGLGTAAPRMALEACVVIGAVQMARGRTHGLLLLATCGLALVLTLDALGLPRIWTECTQVIHPLFDLGWRRFSLRALTHDAFEHQARFFGLPLALIPWALPVVRALRSPPT